MHSPYVVNLASLNNRIRIPSRKLVVQHADGGGRGRARSGWWCTAGTSPRARTPRPGVENWRKFVERQQAARAASRCRCFIENTAGGDNAMARRFDALARLWDAVGEFGVGFCLDTCHAFAAGEELVDVVDRVKAITGRIDLVHLNNSRDEFGSARDRHANIARRHDRPGRAGRGVRRGRGAGRGRDARPRARPPTSRSCASGSVRDAVTDAAVAGP